APYGEFTVPAAAGRYTIRQEAGRGAPVTLSTQVSTGWTARWGHGGRERPPRGRYTIGQEAVRGGPFTLSTQVSTVWTARSGHVAGDHPQPLPLSAIQFSPVPDAGNKGPGGRGSSLPVRGRPQP